MVARNDGLTKTYNRFHDVTGQKSRISSGYVNFTTNSILRCWRPMAGTTFPAQPRPNSSPRPPNTNTATRAASSGPPSFREEVLARLLDLNRARAEEERHFGLVAPRVGTDDDLEEAAE